MKKESTLFTLPGFQKDLTRYKSAVFTLQVLTDMLREMGLEHGIYELNDLIYGGCGKIQDLIAKKALKATLHLKDAAQARSIHIQRIQFDDTMKINSAMNEVRSNQLGFYTEPIRLTEAFEVVKERVIFKPEFKEVLFYEHSIPANETTNKALALCKKVEKAINELNTFARSNGSIAGFTFAPIPTDALVELQRFCSAPDRFDEVFALLPTTTNLLHEMNVEAFHTNKSDFLKIKLTSGALLGLDANNNLKLFPENFIHLKSNQNETEH